VSLTNTVARYGPPTEVCLMILRSLAFFSIIFSLGQVSYATPPCTACGIRGAPSPEIGYGVTGVAVTAMILLGYLVLPRVRKWLRT
jgi:hypothetical protein